jgi:DNA-binding NtrC family response regulator
MVTVATDVQVYFCDPQSPWQRGSNESTNLLLRQYFPRGTDLSGYSQAQLKRREDIPLLVEYFIDRYARKAGKHFKSVEKRTHQVLQSYTWPGNIRELQNVIERSVIVCETASFSVDESWLSHQPPENDAENQLYLSEKVAAQEKEMIEAALRECQGRVSGPSGPAAKLGIARSTLESKIRSLKINKSHFRV